MPIRHLHLLTSVGLSARCQVALGTFAAKFGLTTAANRRAEGRGWAAPEVGFPFLIQLLAQPYKEGVT